MTGLRQAMIAFSCMLVGIAIIAAALLYNFLQNWG